jgi:hypothetical protein
VTDDAVDTPSRDRQGNIPDGPEVLGLLGAASNKPLFESTASISVPLKPLTHAE